MTLQTVHITSPRTRLLAKNIVASLAIKGWSAATVFIMLPLTLACLGAYQNGVWLTVSSLLLWIDQMDIGLGNGLRNRLAADMAHGDNTAAQQAVSSTIAMLVCIVMPVAAILATVVWYADVYAFLNVEPAAIPALRVALLAAVLLVCMTFVLKSVGNVYMGLQLPAASNLIVTTGQTAALAATWLLYIAGQASFLAVVVANTAAPLAVYAIACLYTFGKQYPELQPTWQSVNLKTALSLGNVGVKFFWLQIAAVLQFMTANILIARFFQPEAVTDFQIAYRYATLFMVGFTIVCMPYWNATTDAAERGDYEWIKNAGRRLDIILAAVALAMAAATLVAPYVYHIWIGTDCNIPTALTVAMMLYMFLMIASMRYSFFLNGLGALRLQMYMTMMAVVFIAAELTLHVLGGTLTDFVLIMAACIAPSIAVNIIQLHKLLNRTATGIWNK